MIPIVIVKQTNPQVQNKPVSKPYQHVAPRHNTPTKPISSNAPAATPGPLLVRNPNGHPPKLRRAFGPGFGTGELLVKVPKPGVKADIELADLFIPATLDNVGITRPFQVKATPSPVLESDEPYFYQVLEIANSTAAPPLAQFTHEPEDSLWREFTAANFPILVNLEQQAVIAAFTGVMLKLRGDSKRFEQYRHAALEAGQAHQLEKALLVRR